MINVCCDTLETQAPIHLVAHQLKRINATAIEPDFSLSLSLKQHENLIDNLTAVTLSESTEQTLHQLNQTKYSLIDIRNQIISSIFYPIRPFSKRKLAKIDKQIEILDEQIFSIESQSYPSEEDLSNIVEKAKRRFDILTQKIDIQNDKVESVTLHR
ncbi:TPA: hypothetical protein ACMY2T_002144 [Legionella pneumophila]|uniref:hypothetical protein n=1 Tax=Legionella pneumophila TaxID=446 RepID=UPI000770A8CF|nr:hypothetical protein [Legionella pneumophila]MDW8902221.1 hypothetical protein [Legionella pneumophila]MDW8908287.1 hypothetical protein [Legionella pneumophila]RYX29117.1 hypothetical protein D7271_15150 [Legionella pneumophila]CZP18365.1 Uncharacterised protein [Legionella pneumophila]HAT1765733.1 hypothetical protein [Legionella pneumophila]